MCLFTQPVEAVSGTTMFARVVGGEPPRQILVYQMEFSAAGDLAMVLPIPTPPNSAEDAVQFISLEGYPEFFDDIAKCFPMASRSLDASEAGADETAALEVHDVGAFEASFVPKSADFKRLDQRFQLPGEVWSELGGVLDYGFAVFKLKAGKQKVHPMAFTFPTRNTQQIFFPTTHLHGVKFERRARFDHTLYYQGSDTMRLPLAFDTGTNRLGRLAGQLMGVAGGAKPPRSSHAKAGEFVKWDGDRGLIDPARKIYAFDLKEKLPNRDVVLWPKYHPNAGMYP